MKLYIKYNKAKNLAHNGTYFLDRIIEYFAFLILLLYRIRHIIEVHSIFIRRLKDNDIQGMAFGMA